MVVVTDYDFDADLCEVDRNKKIAEVIAMQKPFGDEREPESDFQSRSCDPDYPYGFLELDCV